MLGLESAKIDLVPAVSILLAVRNGAETLDRAMTSIQNQSFRDFETILVDDGSTDDSAQVAARRGFVNVVKQDSRGVAATRQRLIEEATGEWVTFLDHDDELEPAMLERLLANTTVETVLIHGRKRIDVPGKPPHIPTWTPKAGSENLDHLLPDNQISTCSLIVRRDALLKVGFSPELDKAEDWRAWFGVSKLGEFRFVDEVVATIHKRPDSISRPNLAWYQAERRILEEQLKAEPTERFEKIIRRKLGIIASLEGACLDEEKRRTEARQKHLEALRAAPTRGALLRFLKHLVS